MGTTVRELDYSGWTDEQLARKARLDYRHPLQSVLSGVSAESLEASNLGEWRMSARDFGIEVEFSAQFARAKRWRIYEMGISYYGRTYDEGKKINWKDGVAAFWHIVRFNLF